jgi:hypothetical protein
MPKPTSTIEERVARLEAISELLVTHDETDQQNLTALHKAMSEGVPKIVEGQDAAIAALDTNQKALLQLVKALDNRVVALIESTARHATAIDRLENVLGLQGKVPAN